MRNSRAILFLDAAVSILSSADNVQRAALAAKLGVLLHDTSAVAVTAVITTLVVTRRAVVSAMATIMLLLLLLVLSQCYYCCCFGQQ
jgi:hypothetical protein